MGTSADVIAEPCRVQAQTLIATLQLLLISTRGHRCFTSQELDTIFTDVGMQFFKSMESIELYLDTRRYNLLQRKHERHPSRHAAPVHFRKTLRSVHRESEQHICSPGNIYLHITTYVCMILPVSQICERVRHRVHRWRAQLGRAGEIWVQLKGSSSRFGACARTCRTWRTSRSVLHMRRRSRSQKIHQALVKNIKNVCWSQRNVPSHAWLRVEI